MIGKTNQFIPKMCEATALPGLRRAGRVERLDAYTQKRSIKVRGYFIGYQVFRALSL
jgi:hypothetical protein